MKSASRGRAYPLGATVLSEGVNFSVYSRDAEAMELCLFDRAEDAYPSRKIQLSPDCNQTYHYWHVFVPGAKAGQLYGYRCLRPGGDAEKLLLDPYARAVAVPKSYDRLAASRPGNNIATAMKSVITDRRAYDWEGDQPLRRPDSQSVLYEMHVAGFTRHPNSGLPPHLRGTYRGLMSKIPYLKSLRITAVEFLPIFQFDPYDAPTLKNYWGYAPVSFFAPHADYSARGDYLSPLNEFRDLVKALHRAGIEVILDVVFNHTAEGDQSGPTFCFKGFGPQTYYHMAGGSYANYSGTGNSLNANHSVVRRLILDSLRYWVQECHVDGFRFDLASILARDSQGRPMSAPPILWDIESDPALAGTKLIAEAWDAAGLYQVGSFVGDSWKEWNGKFRDDLRAFLRGDCGTIRPLANRLLGSPDIFAHEHREAEQSVNFVTCHDGFTLNDLVSYNQKHNLANGEDNRDGSEDNLSWNCGQEGPSLDPEVEALRTRQVKNFLVLTLLALGTPMLLMGDEVRRTQRGNNNAYCQDNEISWFDWDLVDQNSALLRFASRLIAYRAERNPLGAEGLNLEQLLDRMEAAFHGTVLGQPDWSEDSHSLALTVHFPGDSRQLHCMLNAYWEELNFELPGSGWRPWVNTAAPSPQDLVEWDEATEVRAPQMRVEARSMVILQRALRAGDGRDLRHISAPE
ncbi:MAG: glycogen debranching protein GlgX [Vulcanimicrobiota bacterium]